MLPPPPAPPLLPGSLFHRPSLSPFSGSSQSFRAKATPFSTPRSTEPNTTNTHAFSSPHAGSARVSGGSRSGHGSGSTVPRASPSPDAPWKAQLRQQCIQRVKAQRYSLQQKLRDAHADKNTPPFSQVGMSEATAAAAMQASAALANSLRDIIQEQYAEQRQQGANRTAASSSSASYSTAASSSVVAAASPFSSSGAAAAADPYDLPSFTVLGDDHLSQDDFIELMEQLEDEVRREMQPQEQSFFQPHQPPFAASAAAAGSSAHVQAMSAADAAAAAAYAAEIEAQEEADMEALSEYFEQQQPFSTQLLPCPICHRNSVGVSAGLAQCSSCGMRYAPCESADEFRQHLSDACELHAVRCRAAPKFIASPPSASSIAAAAASFSSASASVIPAAPPLRLPLALACEVCQTWLSLPVASSWSGPSSQPSSNQSSQQQQEQEDAAMDM